MNPTDTGLLNSAPSAMKLRIYWEDTDAGGVVYYANYLRFFERARTEWLRQLGVEQRQLQLETNAIFVVANVVLRYAAPARLDDTLTITTELIERGSASLLLKQKALRADLLLVEGTVRVGCVDAVTLKPRRMPPGVTRALGEGP